MPEWIESRTSQLLLTISLGPRGNGKKPWAVRINLGNVRVSREKGEILLRQVYGNILHVTDVESPYMLSCLLTPVAKWDRSI